MNLSLKIEVLEIMRTTHPIPGLTRYRIKLHHSGLKKFVEYLSFLETPVISPITMFLPCSDTFYYEMIVLETVNITALIDHINS